MTHPAPNDRAFFGHPRGLSTLFFTEMWERFSYYGMRALLLLYMTAPLVGGRASASTRRRAGAIYGLYTSMVYMTALPGGWIADRLIGQRRAVLYGGILIASGHFSMAFPSLDHVLPRPVPHRARHRAAEGQRQRDRRPALRRDRTSAATPASRSSTWASTSARSSRRSICGYLGQEINWHVGFAAAGVGMVVRRGAVRARRQEPRRLPACARARRLAGRSGGAEACGQHLGIAPAGAGRRSSAAALYRACCRLPRRRSPTRPASSCCW